MLELCQRQGWKTCCVTVDVGCRDLAGHHRAISITSEAAERSRWWWIRGSDLWCLIKVGWVTWERVSNVERSHHCWCDEVYRWVYLKTTKPGIVSDALEQTWRWPRTGWWWLERQLAVQEDATRGRKAYQPNLLIQWGRIQASCRRT